MDRRTLLTIAAAGAANLAGCVGSDGDQPGDEPGATNEPDDGTGDDGSGDGTGDDGTGDDGSDGDDWVDSEPDEALRQAGNFTSTWTWEVSDPQPGGAEKMVYTSLVNLDDERAYTKLDFSGDNETTMEIYQTSDKRYNRATDQDGENPTTWVEEREFDPKEFLFTYGYSYDTSELETWSDEGTETYDGVTVRRYVYEDDQPYVAGQGGHDMTEVTKVTFVMLVDENGIPRYQSHRVEGTDDEGNDVWYEWDYSITDVGSTTVEEPDWIDEAAG